MTFHNCWKANSWIGQSSSQYRPEEAKPLPNRTAPAPTPSHTTGTRRKSWTDLDLRGGGVLEAEALASAPLLARLLEKSSLLLGPPRSARHRADGSTKKNIVASLTCLHPCTTTEKNQQKIPTNSWEKKKENLGRSDCTRTEFFVRSGRH